MFPNLKVRRLYQDPQTLKGFGRIFYEFWFWIHLAVWSLVLIAPFIFGLWLIVLGYIAYQLHLLLLNGCIFTLWQQKYGILPKNEEYYQAIFRRVFKLESRDRRSFFYSFWLSRLVEYYVLIAAVVVYLVKR